MRRWAQVREINPEKSLDYQIGALERNSVTRGRPKVPEFGPQTNQKLELCELGGLGLDKKFIRYSHFQPQMKFWFWTDSV